MKPIVEMTATLLVFALHSATALALPEGIQELPPNSDPLPRSALPPPHPYRVQVKETVTFPRAYITDVEKAAFHDADRFCQSLNTDFNAMAIRFVTPADNGIVFVCGKVSTVE